MFLNIDSLFWSMLSLKLVNEGFTISSPNALFSFVFSFLSELGPVSLLHLSKLSSFPLLFSLTLPMSTFSARSLATLRLKEWWGLPKWLVWADFKPRATQSSCLTSFYRKILNSLIFFWGAGVPYCLGHNFAIILSQPETALSPREESPFSTICYYHLFSSSCWYGRLLIFLIFFFRNSRWGTWSDLRHSPMGTSAYAKKPWEAPSQEQGKSVTAAFGSSTVSDWLKLLFNDATFNVVSRSHWKRWSCIWLLAPVLSPSALC